jgi:hypothetical protein
MTVLALGEVGAVMSLKSEIKVGSQFEFSIDGEKGTPQKAVVTRFLSNREEGFGPEVDFYIADWMEARSLSEPPKALLFHQGADGNIYLDEKRVELVLEESPGTEQK